MEKRQEARGGRLAEGGDVELGEEQERGGRGREERRSVECSSGTKTVSSGRLGGRRGGGKRGRGGRIRRIIEKDKVSWKKAGGRLRCLRALCVGV
jgi:hypothetical protein